MPHPLSYTNRQGSTAYIRAVTAKKGGTRYYITKEPQNPDLIEEMPAGFEFYENPADARIIFRKRKPSHIYPSERQLVEDAMANLSAVSDFIVEAQEKEIMVYISQFSSIAGQEESLSAEEARKLWGEHSDRWKQYRDYVRFVLVSRSPRVFAVERIVFMSFFGHDYVELERSTDLEYLAEKICEHIGRDTYFDLVPEGFADEDN
ncbi:hypothetical protein [Telluribacter sp.]|jgi:hypothetical protein|uniref:hypothetical protein n=1 Tax=Telluribacter sp. TaxID=1978767 RepID=UPI002E0DBD30|nr:hypothetical protein [Telluribacter sp.]